MASTYSRRPRKAAVFHAAFNPHRAAIAVAFANLVGFQKDFCFKSHDDRTPELELPIALHVRLVLFPCRGGGGISRGITRVRRHLPGETGILSKQAVKTKRHWT